MNLRFPSYALALILTVFTCPAQHALLLQGNDRLVQLAADGSVTWEMPWGGIHDVHVLPNGHIMVQRDMREVVEIDPATKQVVWAYNAAEMNGNAGKKVEVHAFQPLADGQVMIAESGPARIIEIDRSGALLKEIPLTVDHPHPHMDTRLARKLDNGHYLVCHEGDGVVREYDGEGKVVWEYEVPLFGREKADGHGPKAWGNKTFCALRLSNSNTLLSTGNGHGVLEVSPGKEIVWQLAQTDLPGVTLAWVTTLEVLPNGTLVLGNCHAGPGQPLLIEIEQKSKKIVWAFERFDDLGNNVSNTVLLDAPVGRIR